MGRAFDKIVSAVLIIVVVTFLVNHGHIDFSGLDWVVQKTKDAVQSEEGQEIVQELKETTNDVLKELTGEVIDRIKTASQSHSLIEASLVRVVDGDTIVVKIDGEETKVRLIGVDTPESVHSDSSKNNKYGELASSYTKELLKGFSTIYLEFDSQEFDKYERLLAYVWLDKDKSSTTENIGKYMLNGILVKDGYAISKKFAPNTRYTAALDQLQEDSEQANNGLWKEPEFVALWD